MRSTNGFTPPARTAGRLRAIIVAFLALTALVVAGCGGSDSTDTGTSGGSATTASNGISGKRFVVMLQSTPSTSKVVTAHAIELGAW